MYKYGLEYGHLVFDDCTYNSNRFRRPLIIRCILDCELKVRIIGIGILRDEKAERFKWWNKNFDEIYNFRIWNIIYTDEDKA